MPGKSSLVLLLTTLIWGSTFVIAKDVLAHRSPLAYLSVRFALASLVLLLIFPRSLRAITRIELRAGATLGALLGGGMLLQAAGQVTTTATKSAFITSLATPLVPLVAFLISRARPTRANFAGVVVAFLGGVLLLVPSVEDGAGEASSSSSFRLNAGDVLTLGCTLFFATHITLMERFTRICDVRRLTVVQICTSALLLAAGWAATAGASATTLTPQPLNAGEAWRLVYLALVGTVAAFLLWAWGQRGVSAVRAAVIFNMEPIFAMLFAVGVRGRSELLGGWAALGAGLVVAGVLISELLPEKKKE